MTTLLETNDNVRKVLYSCIVLAILFFYYKLAKHPQKSYGLLMIVILITSIFFGAGFRLFRLFGYNSDILLSAMIVLSKFDVLWLTCLAVYHYSILRTFKGKFRKFPFKAFILYAVLICFAISLITSHTALKNWDGDSYLTDVVSAVILLYIACKSKHFGEGIQFGPYSIHESASRLYKFASLQAFFASFDCVLALIIDKSSCLSVQSSDSKIYYCGALDFFNLILYQCWVWYAVYFNWKMLVMSSRRETTDVLPISTSTSASNSQRNSAYLGAEIYTT